jgi:two-component system chemotaxis sensor kinase CheA
MPINSKIREQIISTFKVELNELMQIISDGLLQLEKPQLTAEERQSTIRDVFRAAHSLKGAARAVGITSIEQLGHGLENILSDLQRGAITPFPDLYTACYHMLDAIQMAETAYEAGEMTAPDEAMQALTELNALRDSARAEHPAQETRPEAAVVTPDRPPVISIPREETVFVRIADPEPPRSTVTPIEAPTAPVIPAAPGAPAPWTDETIRVRIEKLDAVITQLSELVMAKIRLDQRALQINQLQNMVADWQKEWTATRDQYTQKKYVRGGVVAQAGGKQVRNQGEGSLTSMLSSQSFIKDITNKLNDLSRDYTNDTVHISLVIDALEQEVKQIRLLPLSTITGTFGRMIRDLANSTNKEIEFEIIGAEVEMDKRVLELVKDPLIHLLRNAIDHGIESPADRKKQDKSPVAKITLSAEHQGKDVILRVSDDGRGLDTNAIRRAVARYTGTDNPDLSEAELIGWIFNTGITTSAIITDVSGRGVGLDIVRRNIETLHGRIDVSTMPGSGTSFILTIPMALTSSHVLIIQVANYQYALPLSSVERIISIKPEQISSVGGQRVLRYNGRPIPLTYLKKLLALPDQEEEKPAEDAESLAVILGAAERRMAFIVDELLGEQEIVIKGMGKQLARIGGIAGATVLGSGKVMLVLNAADLIKMASHSDNRGASSFHPVATTQIKKKVTQKRILVVDDSITTRTLEKHILEAEGFIVQVATDGQEALSVIATSGLPDLLISDINMPRIDGFELTSRIKSDPRTNSLPVFLVSSLDSSEDKAHGIQVGADAYIVKSQFDQTNLLQLIQQIIG